MPQSKKIDDRNCGMRHERRRLGLELTRSVWDRLFSFKGSKSCLKIARRSWSASARDQLLARPRPRFLGAAPARPESSTNRRLKERLEREIQTVQGDLARARRTTRTPSKRKVCDDLGALPERRGLRSRLCV